jgi:hypothetical protein
MRRRRRAALWAMLAIAIAAGTFSDRVPERPAPSAGGYRILAADFHVHPALFSAGALAPWDLVLEARRQGLDAFAITPHNQMFTARIGPWIARVLGGPTVIPGEEVRGSRYHLIALGITHHVEWDQDASAAIDDVHRQGGVAIAAHPGVQYWPAYSGAMTMLDGSEVMHPAALRGGRTLNQLRTFYQQGPRAAIGSSDYHGLGRLGMCRTYVFARDDSAASIIEAVRAGRTVVYDSDGRAVGDPDLIRLADAAHVRDREPRPERATALVVISRVVGVLALLALALL